MMEMDVNGQGGDVQQLLELARKNSSWHLASVFLGMSLALGLVGIVVFLTYNKIQNQVERMRRSHAADMLDKLDGESLKKICGNTNLPAWIRYPDFERVQWVNDLIDQLWPNIKAAAAGIVREQIGPQLRENKPAWISDISIHSFALGNKPPQISSIKVFNTDSVFDEIAIEMECVWNGAQKFQLAIQPLPRVSVGFIAVEKAVSKLLSMRLGVADLFFKGNVRIALKPLLDRMPLIGAAKISLVDAPEFAYALNLQGGDMTFLPGLEAWLNSFIQRVVLQPYILPEGITVPIDPEATKAQLPRGILYVKVLEAKHLPWLDWLSRPTTYVRLGVRGRLRQRTVACKHSFTPRWDEEFMLLVHEPDKQALSMILYDQQDFVAEDKIVGQVSLPVKDMKDGETVQKWIPLEASSSFKFGNPVAMGVQGVQTVRDVARDAIHLPFNLRGKKNAEVHIQMTYHEIEEKDVDAARGDGDAAENQETQQDAQLVRMLRGGILLIKVRKETEEEGLHVNNSTQIVDVSVGGQTKGTAATYGEEDPSWDEIIEFALPGDVLEKEDEQIEVKVWDTHWVNKTRENLTWDVRGKTPEGIVKIPLKRVVEEQKLEDTFRLENLGGSIDMEITWMPLLNT